MTILMPLLPCCQAIKMIACTSAKQTATVTSYLSDFVRATLPFLLGLFVFFCHSASALTATTTVLTSGTNPAAVAQSVTLTATVTGATPTGTVTFKDGATTLGTGTISAGKATFAASFTIAGSHSLTAVYAGNATNAASASAALSETVNARSTTTVLTSGTNPATVGQSVTLTAHGSGPEVQVNQPLTKLKKTVVKKNLHPPGYKDDPYQ